MDEVPPGPERDRLWPEMEEHRAALERELLAGPPFPVYEAIGTGLRHRAIGQTSGSEAGLEMVELVLGSYVQPASEPMIAVRTEVCDPSCLRWAPEDLADVLADERDDRADETEVDVPEPRFVEQRRAVLPVDEAKSPAYLRIEDDCWAALLADVRTGDHPSVHVQVLVTARGVPLERVRLVRVGDLRPYVHGSRRLMSHAREFAAQDVVPEDLDLPEAEGFDAHRALVTSLVTDVAELRRAAKENRRPPRMRRRLADGQSYARSSESAVRAQVRLAGQDREAAGDAVSSLVNHMIQLAKTTDWFDDPATRTAAIEESIRWTVFESDVSSRAAQEAWVVSWTAEQSITNAYLAGDLYAVRGRQAARDEGRTRWLAAWTAWHAGRQA